MNRTSLDYPTHELAPAYLVETFSSRAPAAQVQGFDLDQDQSDASPSSVVGGKYVGMVRQSDTGRITHSSDGRVIVDHNSFPHQEGRPIQNIGTSVINLAMRLLDGQRTTTYTPKDLTDLTQEQIQAIMRQNQWLSASSSPVAN